MIVHISGHDVDTREVGKRITKARMAASLTKKELADKIQVAPSTIGRYEEGKIGKLKMPVVYAIADVLGVNPHWLLCISPFIDEEDMMQEYRRLENSVTAVRIPVLGRVVAGVPLEAVENIIAYEEISAYTARNGEFFALQVKGDSMAPRICDGDVVIVKKQQTVENGDVAIVLVNNSEATIKKVNMSESGITLIAYNPVVYEPHFYTKEDVANLPVSIVGKVVEFRGKP